MAELSGQRFGNYDGLYDVLSQSSKKIARKTRYLIGASGFVAAITAFIMQKYFIKVPATNADDHGAMILLVFSIVMIIIAAGVKIIAKRQNKDDEM